MINADLAPLSRPIDSLRLDPRNARKHSARNLQAIEASLRTYGQQKPVVALEDGTLVAGNGTWQAAKALGWTDIAAVVFEDAAKAQAYAIADNRTGELAAWDMRELTDQLGELADLGQLDGLGFSDEEVEALLRPTEAPEGGALAERFLVPPFTVLRAASGWWMERKRRWMALGLASEIGRGDRLVFANNERMHALQKQRGTGGLETGGGLKPGKAIHGTSIFDPVLCELLYRWFCPHGGSVLDPFAGGSVRGVVAAWLGRAYVGIDLAERQVEANRAQWTAITGEQATLPMVDDPAALTPVEERGGIRIKRDDLLEIGGVRGGKVRSCWALAQGAQGGLVTAGSRSSPQVNIVAHLAQQLGLGCRVHVPQGELSPEVQAAADVGATVVQHKAGYNNVIIARAREDVLDHVPGWRLIPFGMECQEAVDQTAGQVGNLPADVVRLVVPVGSGMSLAGILQGLAAAGRQLPVLGVVVGADPEPRLESFAPPGWRERVELVPSGTDYHEAAEECAWHGLQLDAHYEAKCIPFLQDGDCLWNVGIRQTSAAAERPLVPQGMAPPRWLHGDSTQLDAWVGAWVEEVDFVFTCPPYHDLEVYSDAPEDLSAMTWDDFLLAYRKIVALAVARLKPDRFAAIVVSEVRDGDGCYRGLVPETIRAFEDAGARLYNEAILVTPIGTLPLRTQRAFRGSRKMGKGHQNVLVFVKGNPAAATAACGEVDVEWPDGQEPA